MFEAAELGLHVTKEEYKSKVPKLRVRLLHLQERLKNAPFPVLILINGADGAGKGEVVNILHEWMDPRFLLTYGFGPLTKDESQRPPFWRFWRALPPQGRIGIFFGSWYTRPIIKRAYGEIADEEFDVALQRIKSQEKTLVDDGMLLIKFWFHLSKKDQKKSLKNLKKDPENSWRVSKLDFKHLKMYDLFRGIDENALRVTSTGEAPWTIVEAVDRRYQCLTVGNLIAEQLEKRLEAWEAAKAAKVAQKEKGGLKDAGAEEPSRKSAKKIEAGKKHITILDKLDLTRTLTPKEYKQSQNTLQGKLNRLYRKAKKKGVASILIFEGWDAGGKGGAIRRITGALDSRDYRVVPIAAPTDEERAHQYLWRFWRHLPDQGHITIFDRSWYGRVMVERVEGYAREEEWARAYAEINDFEEQLAEHGYALNKFFLHISSEEQLRRFEERQKTPWKHFKITEEDWRNREKWDLYEKAVNELIERTSTEYAPWTLVEADSKEYARTKVLETFYNTLKQKVRKT
ncbi:MAG: polyphosphate:AMP phosphotransferase [Pseudomonadota bacterium]|uniref:Polyphosphate:AMP phosphotransferase n=1 Tax=Candidatus Desulfatibia profunda TaxID=2841695 RepID=A0A8J6NMD7_9BACT|nr:polyphosphate:AMP phosphotransferase [Candidatus Desulfatibia profunda]